MIETGTVLQDRFLIEKELARGGMGAVYLATDQKFGSRVAIKERFYEDPLLAEAFAREARILNCLHHPILPHVSDYFSEGGGHFLVMEYIEGEDLSEILKREGKAFEVNDVVRWMLELLDGLDYLHSQDPPIIHRDIKPGNLKLTSRGNIVLLDFGLAKETSAASQGAQSVFGYSRRYSPLEQIQGAGTTTRSDIFSLGATAFHLITGTVPVDVLARASAIVAGREDPLPVVSTIETSIDAKIADVIHRALALDPEQRFASAAEMRSALETAAEASSAAAAPLVIPIDSEPAADFDDRTADEATNTSNPPAFAPVIESEQPSTPRRHPVVTAPARRIVRPLWYRPAFWVAAIVIALTTLGLGLSKFLGESSTQPQAEQTANANTVETDLVREPVQEPAEAAEPVAKQTKEASRPSERSDQANRTPARRAADVYIPEEELDEEILDEEPVRVEPRRRAPVRPRRIQRDRIIREEPPVSSIEMIFTGIPPDSRRRRRNQPD